MSKTPLDRLHDSTREMYDTIAALEAENARLQERVKELEDEQERRSEDHSKWLGGVYRQRDGYKARDKLRGKALEGVGSRIGDKWHRIGCEAFEKPYGECDYACFQARAAIDALPDEAREKEGR